MAWSKLAPTAPPSFQEMLADQANRLANNNYGAGFGGWSPTDGSYSGDTSYDYEGEKGNPFFTATNQPGQTSVTTSTRAPFIWSGDNESLRKAYEQSYDAYWAGVPSSSTFNRTWDGPQIRPLYEEQHGGFGDDYGQAMDSLPTNLDFGAGSAGTPQERQRQVSTGLQNIGTRNYWQDNNKNAVYNPLEDDAFLPLGDQDAYNMSGF